MSTSAARKHADQLIARLRIRSPAVDVEDIARRLGLRIVEMKLRPDQSGLLISQPGLAPCIVINDADPPNRKRFTIAHEIGHHVLRHHFGDEYVHADSLTSVSYRGEKASAGTDPKEIAANQFASSLLMPTALIKRAWDLVRTKVQRDDFEQIVSELAKRFQVSEQAMTLRLKSLRYL